MQPKRTVVTCELHNERFKQTPRAISREYKHQYHHIYAHRLGLVRAFAVQAAVERWGSAAPVMQRVLDARDSTLCVVVGTVFKDMRGKMDVLAEVAKSSGVTRGGFGNREAGEASDHGAVVQTYTGEGDSLMVEDESGRMKLKGTVDPSTSTLVTGVVVAVLGCGTPLGDFVVDDLVLPGPPPFPEAPEPPLSPPAGSAQVLLVSGLAFGSPRHNELSTSLLCDFICGRIHRSVSSSIVHVIIAGAGCVTSTPRISRTQSGNIPNATTHKMGSHSLSLLDKWVYQIACSGVGVHIMPAVGEPTTNSLPHQPLHPTFFPLSSHLAAVRCVCDPHDVTIANTARFMGTCGASVHDSLKHTEISAFATAKTHPAVEMLALHLSTHHLAPTAPDTLPCCPFAATDPFVMPCAPHVLFSGDCETFAQLRVPNPHGEGSTVVVCVPQFYATGTAVLVDVHTKECRPVSFGGL